MAPHLFRRFPKLTGREQFPQLFPEPVSLETDQQIEPPPILFLARVFDLFFPPPLVVAPLLGSALEANVADDQAEVTLDDILNDDIRKLGVHIQSGKGSGKSTKILGRGILYADSLREILTICIDPLGASIDSWLAKVMELPESERERILQRVIYYDIGGGSGHVIPDPFYFRLPGDTLFKSSQRPLETIKKLDSNLVSASIRGWNSLRDIGTKVGVCLTGLGAQITEAESLLYNTKAWLPLLNTLANEEPEAKEAAAYFHRYSRMSEREKQDLTSSFLNKVAPLSHNPIARAAYGVCERGIDFGQAEADSRIILVDGRSEHIAENMKFKMRWFFDQFIEYVRRRGVTRRNPVSLIFDEISYLFEMNASRNDTATADLDELINRLSRNANIMLTFSHQELHNITDESIQKTLLDMGIQIFGVSRDEKTALALQKLYSTYDPHRIKKTEPVYNQGVLSHYRTTEYTPQEWDLIDSRRFLELVRYHFLVALPTEEGSSSTTLRPMNLEQFDAGKFPNEQEVAVLRQALAERSGRKVAELNAEVDQRLALLFGHKATDAKSPPPLGEIKRSEPLE